VNADEVVREITRRSWRFGVAVLLSPERHIDSDGHPSGGHFDEDGKILAVATGRLQDTWLGTLLHEYSHLTQWVEGQPAWSLYRDEMWDWIDGKAIRNPRQAVKTVQVVEEDCERRAVRLIKELDAPIDVQKYARGANAYIHFHNTMAERRKWMRPDVIMMERPELLALCNPTIDAKFDKTPPLLRAALLDCI